MIVKTVVKGDTTFIYHDDYCKDTTPEEVRAILKRIGEIALPALKAAEARKEETG